MPAQGLGDVHRDPRQIGCGAGRAATATPQSGAGRRCCWSITRICSSTRSPTTSAQTGAEVPTLRPDLARAELRRGRRPISCVLSPGPGRPADFAMARDDRSAGRASLPIFGVCLGLQGIVEYFGGALDVLGIPITASRR